ncbi:Similar to jockey\pol: RNA-directed DNA polymerase from mobile element jockey (Drosophila funebris) [Cotesia congregata]|uniref:Similar to jockey\pol: RNA-directed DNA polymerase from mobile element jockey (Drosophila funebris) n=1 Tax=Cotesia congregata TaxID=51543 RepID=A0A8J2HGB0_COTCN|nr:Similar to jockey\pol: RNA-directed DNA polymerase from mobile element jockey (Drosophila funebris) [Cotesia congregata]
MDQSNKRKSINIVQWNANKLTAFLSEFNVDILLVSETKLKTSNKCHIKNYACYRKDRPTNTASGGVAIFIKKSIQHSLVSINTKSLEAIGIKIPGDVLIVSCYNHPNTNIHTGDLDYIFKLGNKIIIAGDLNAKHALWHCKRANTSGKILYSYMQSNPVDIQFPDAPTRISNTDTLASTIDIALIKNVAVSKPKVLNQLDSDHQPVQITILNKYVEHTVKKVLLYDKTN